VIGMEDTGVIEIGAQDDTCAPSLLPQLQERRPRRASPPPTLLLPVLKVARISLLLCTDVAAE
jgi:hypothetical protein